MAGIQPFEINIPTTVLDDLQRRLQNTRWLQPVGKDAGWDYGTNLDYLRELVDYWQHGYNWKEQEKELNAFPHFKAEVDDYNLHFIHQRGRTPHRVPLLLLHGWPDSFYRFHRIAPFSRAPRLFGSMMPIPSIWSSLHLPGFGFTDCPAERAREQQPIRHDAEILWKLMTRVLGYERFAIAGGDGGSPLAQIIAIDHPGSVIGIYLTDLGWQASNTDQSTLDKKERHYLETSQKEFMKQGAYAWFR